MGTRPGFRRGRDVLSPAIWATTISAHFSYSNVAQMSRRLNGQTCSHFTSALNAGAKRSGATCHMAMPPCCYLAKGATRPSHTTNMQTSSNISVNWSIWSTHLVDTFVAHVTDALLSPKWLMTKCPWPVLDWIQSPWTSQKAFTTFSSVKNWKTREEYRGMIWLTKQSRTEISCCSPTLLP